MRVGEDSADANIMHIQCVDAELPAKSLNSTALPTI